MRAAASRSRALRRARGVSLIEALVALGVMAFGILGVVGMQMSMRLNSDTAKQRSEATRLAQRALESRRAFTVIPATAGRLAYADLVDAASEDIVGDNATFTRTVTIPELGSGRTKTVVIEVAWTDRSNTVQTVRLASAVTGNLPELSVALGLPPDGDARSRSRKPLSRHAAIPPSSLDQLDGTSLFPPPGGGGMQWMFDNSTGYIIKTCPLPPAVCTTFNARLLAGFVRFALTSSQPTPAMAEQPPSGTVLSGIEVSVDVTSTPSDPSLACFEEEIENSVAYFCAVPVDPLTGGKWSGRSKLAGGGLSIGSNISDDNDDRHKVCRYTTVRGSHPLVRSTFTNQEHPLDYLNATESLINQNFLVIRAGDDDDPFVCPADDSSTPFVNGNTWYHQPSS